MGAVLTLARDGRTPPKEFYLKKKRERGSGKAICAAARKLLTVIDVMLKSGQDSWYAEGHLYGQMLSAPEAA
jgi:hypothetical protein